MKEIKEFKNILYRVALDWPNDGVNFVDLTPTLNNAESFRVVATALKDKIVEESGDIDYIVSPDARGFLWGSYVAALLHKPLIPIRKKGKIPEEFVQARTSDKTEYSSIELDIPVVDLNGKKCVFVDDVYATGGTYRASQKLVKASGGTLDEAYVVLNVLLTEDKVNALMTSDELDISQKKDEPKHKIKIIK